MAEDDDEDVAEEMALAEAGADAKQAASDFLRAKTEVLKAQQRQLHLGHFREWLYTTAELLVGLVILLVFVGVASAVWSAATDRGLVIEAFSVPPDLAARGLTGQVVAAQLQDKLTAMQGETASMRAASSYQNNWGNDIKVQIPDTGVSIGEFNRYLRDWLGSETHISGDIYRTASGIAVTARAGSGQAATFAGAESDLGALLQKAAEAIYDKTQPYRYAVYLMDHNRNAEAERVYTALSESPSVQERPWAYIGLANLVQARGDVAGALKLVDRAIAVSPGFVLGYINRADYEQNLQHSEAEYRDLLKVDSILRSGEARDINPFAADIQKRLNETQMAGAVQDLPAVLAVDKDIESRPDYSGSIENARNNDIQAYAQMHDAAAVSRLIASLPPTKNTNVEINRDAGIVVAQLLLSHWKTVLASRAPIRAEIAKFGAAGDTFLQRGLAPITAYALAMTGDFAHANALAAKFPPDCDNCLRVRGFIAAAEKNWPAALRRFARETARTPSLPMGYTDWGWALLHKGDADAAIAKFRLANEKGPHFADPLEYWGEALIRKNRSDLALAKFAEAAKDAPNWGRLHLKWGEALYWSGDKKGAQKQFAIAVHLDLTPSEKSELDRVTHG
jgi:tetratricopeptide (TPR) repeat protein